MAKMRFSIARLMGFVVVVALGVAGLKNANELWASACYTLLLLILVLSILHAVQTRGRDRAYWVGFAVAGWIYAAALFGTFGSDDVSTTPPLLTQVVFDQIELLVHPEMAVTTASFTFTPTPVPPGATFTTAFTTTSVAPPAALPAPSSPLIAPAPAPPLPATLPAPMPPTVVNVVPPPIVASGAPPVAVTGTTTISSVPLPAFAFGPSDTTHISYAQVAHSLAALLAGMLGGLYSAWLLGRRERREAAGTTNVDEAVVDGAEVSPSSP